LVIGKIIGRDLLRCCGAAILGFTAISAPARSADPGLETADRIAVLDAGTFLRVEAHNATLGEMLDRLKADAHRAFRGQSRGFDLDEVELQRAVLQRSADEKLFVRH